MNYIIYKSLKCINSNNNTYKMKYVGEYNQDKMIEALRQKFSYKKIGNLKVSYLNIDHIVFTMVAK